MSKYHFLCLLEKFRIKSLFQLVIDSLMFMKFLFKSCADVTTAVTPQKVGNDQAIGQTVQNRHNWSKYML